MTQDAYHIIDFTLSLHEHIEKYLASISGDPGYNGFEASLLRNVRLCESNLDRGTIVYQFDVLKDMCNKPGVLHGGAISTLFDNLSSTALFTISRPGFWHHLGVSRSLAVWFHSPLPEGVEVRLICKLVSAGRRMATVSAILEDSSGKVCASCVHEKFFVGDEIL